MIEGECELKHNIEDNHWHS